MAISPEVRQQIIEVLSEKVGRIRPCPVCGQDEIYNLTPTIVNLAFNETGNSMAVGNQYATHLVLVCGKCGCTRLLNTSILGVLEMLPVSGQSTVTAAEAAQEPANGNGSNG